MIFKTTSKSVLEGLSKEIEFNFSVLKSVNELSF